MGVRIGVDCEGILVVAGAHDEKQSVLVTEVINELSPIAGTLAKGAFCVADRVVDDDYALCLGCRTIQSLDHRHDRAVDHADRQFSQRGALCRDVLGCPKDGNELKNALKWLCAITDRPQKNTAVKCMTIPVA